MTNFNLKVRESGQIWEIRNKYNELVDVVIMLSERLSALESSNTKENITDENNEEPVYRRVKGGTTKADRKK